MDGECGKFYCFSKKKKDLENVFCKLDFSTIIIHNFGHDDFLKYDQFHYVLYTV